MPPSHRIPTPPTAGAGEQQSPPRERTDECNVTCAPRGGRRWPAPCWPRPWSSRPRRTRRTRTRNRRPRRRPRRTRTWTPMSNSLLPKITDRHDSIRETPPATPWPRSANSAVPALKKRWPKATTAPAGGSVAKKVLARIEHGGHRAASRGRVGAAVAARGAVITASAARGAAVAARGAVITASPAGAAVAAGAAVITALAACGAAVAASPARGAVIAASPVSPAGAAAHHPAAKPGKARQRKPGKAR